MQTGGLLDSLTVRVRARVAVKKSLNFKAGLTATTTLTPHRREQIVESRDPISNPCDRK